MKRINDTIFHECFHACNRITGIQNKPVIWAQSHGMLLLGTAAAVSGLSRRNGGFWALSETQISVAASYILSNGAWTETAGRVFADIHLQEPETVSEYVAYATIMNTKAGDLFGAFIAHAIYVIRSGFPAMYPMNNRQRQQWYSERWPDPVGDYSQAWDELVRPKLGGLSCRG